MSFTVQTDRRLIRAEGYSARYVLLSFAAPESAHTVAREPVSIALVIDRSGSMAGSKIGLARQAVVQALRMLKSCRSIRGRRLRSRSGRARPVHLRQR